MGPKITIDSATLMNKGLELIEAHHLFALAPDETRRRSCTRNRSCTAWSNIATARSSRSSAAPDMRIPIAHCLAWPERMDGRRRRGSISPRLRHLTFEEPDPMRFPALALARRGARSRRRGADRAQCRQRGRGRRIRRQAAWLSRDCRAGRGHPRGRRTRRRDARNRNRSTRRSPLTIMQEG